MKPTDRKLLEGRYALITGSSRGIGRAMAECFARAGCNVAVTSRSPEECLEVAAGIARAYNVQAIGLQVDVSRQAGVQELFRNYRVWATDRLDVLVCNAGYPLVPEIWNTPLHATPSDKLRAWYLDVFNTDAMGAVYSTFEALPLMKARRSGSIVYVSSTPALEGFQGAPYTMAKSAILGLMKEVAREYGRDNIRANAIAPGNIQTPATVGMLDEASLRALAAEAPLNRWGLPEEIGSAALFLASELSGFVSGQVLVVDGGTLRR